MVADFLFQLLSSGPPIFGAVPWQTYLGECTKFIMVDSDSTDGSKKIRAAQASHELMSLPVLSSIPTWLPVFFDRF